MKQVKQVPHDVVSEFIGQFSLKGSMNKQVQIAEQIASNYYSDLDSLADTIKGYGTKDFNKELEGAKLSDYFKPYWKNDQN